LGRLDGAVNILPDPALFLYTFQRKEALLSAQIEGTQNTLVDLLQFELAPRPSLAAGLDDLTEASNYVAAVYHCLERMRKDGFPLSLRLIREAHAILLRSGRGEHSTPGEFRRSQNWVGGTCPADAIFVPPPAEHVVLCMDALEKYIYAEDDTPLLIKTGLVHAQFESIHPFLDGNGRLGRMLITLMLCARNALEQPLLYPSLHLKQRRTEYYDCLTAIRTHGDWEGWTKFYLTGILQVAGQAARTAVRVVRLFEEHRTIIREQVGRSRRPLDLHACLTANPVVTAKNAAQLLQVTEPTARKAIETLERIGLVKEISARGRGRVYAYMPYIDILAEGTTEAPG